MMKSFFKKLAFVMALAMVVTLAAPAAKTAVAAEAKELAIGYQTGMAITEVNLAKVGDTEDLRFLYAPENWKELGVKWTSSNENVVTVDNSGLVTAVAEGSAIVSVAVGTETATVTVNVVDLPTYTATMGTADDRNMTEATLEVEESIDLAFYGIKDYSRDLFGNGTPRYFCEWTSTDETVATVDTKGLVTAVAPGKAKITLVVWNLKLNIKHNVDACWITVPEVEPEATPAPAMEVLNQRTKTKVNTSQNTIEIAFDKAVDLEPEDVTLFRIFTAADDETGLGEITDPEARKGYEDFYVKNVWKNDDSKTVWTVLTFQDFADGVWYEVNVTGYDKDEFQASVGPVNNVEVEATTPSLASEEGDLDLVPSYLSVKLYDAKGVDVTTLVVNGVINNDESNITYWLADEDYEKFNLLNYNEIEFYEKATAKAMATYDANDVLKDSATPTLVTPKTHKAYGVEKVIDWTIIKEGSAPDWTATVKEVPAGEYNYILVTLLQDTRGDYYVTNAAGAGTDKELGNGIGKKTVYYTEDETKPFWLNGLYVEYKAMHMDTMLVEIDGEIASYEEGRARFALYLYDQTKSDEFVEEILSQYVKVCHPRELDTFDVSATTLDIMKNTEDEYQHRDYATKDVIADAYYSEFSTADLKITLKDIHGDKADEDDAKTARFTLTLTTEKDSNEELKTLVEETLEERLNDKFEAAPQEFKVTFGAKDFQKADGSYITNKSQVRFSIYDETTKTRKNITINLISLVQDEVKLDTDGDNDIDTVLKSDVDLIKVFEDKMPTPMYFEKFVVKSAKISVEQKVYDADDDNSYKNNGHFVVLYQQDVKGHDIGFESDIWVANAAIAGHKLNVDNILKIGANDGDDVLSVGDRVLVITDKSGKVYPVLGDKEYNNPAYNAKEGKFAAPKTTMNLGVTVKDNALEAESASGTAVYVDKYQFVFRTAEELVVDGTSEGNELIYAKEGTYTAEIRTIREITDPDESGNVYAVFTKATGLSDKVTFTVANNNDKVAYKNRDYVRYDDRSVYSYTDGDATVTKQMGNAEDVKDLILETFNFTLGGANWGEDNDGTPTAGKLDADDILYYTYTVTPSNNQLVINSVTFKVPVVNRDKWGNITSETGDWYRSTCTVNKSITFGE